MIKDRVESVDTVESMAQPAVTVVLEYFDPVNYTCLVFAL